MIRLTCPGCQSHLNAKDELVGQTRKCPKCGTEIVIMAPAAPEPPLVEPLPPEPSAEPWVPPSVPSTSPAEPSIPPADAPEGDTDISLDEPLPTFRGPERLTRLNHYVICNSTAVVACWQNNGRGWMVYTPTGFVSATRNHQKIPTAGTFQLLDFQMKTVDDVLRLDGLFVYRLNNRWALLNLSKGDDAVMSTISAAGSLNREQKAAVREFLREHLMRSIWENAETVLEYLGNVDYHSPGVSPPPPPDLPTAAESESPWWTQGDPNAQ